MAKVKISKEEIEELIKILTEEELFKLYPEAKKLYSKTSHVFYMIKPGAWMKCYYLMKDGSCCSDHEDFKMDDVDYSQIRPNYIYTGNEKTKKFKDVWLYSSSH